MFQFPEGIKIQDVKGCGTSGMVALIPSTNTVLKFPLSHAEERDRCRHEHLIYKLLAQPEISTSRPESLLQFHGSGKDGGIVLEYAELGPVRHYLRDHDHLSSDEILLRWTRQAASALHFLHENGIVHGEVDCTNLFLTSKLDIRLGDFTVSEVFDQADLEYEAGVKNDIIDFGSALYEMVTGLPPHAEMSVQERKQLLADGIFPDLRNLQLSLLSDLIMRCWKGELTHMQAVLDSLNQASKSRNCFWV